MGINHLKFESMKKSILITILVAIFATGYAQYGSERIGFAGVTVPISINKLAGFGMEIATLKNNPGIGLKVEYIPAEHISTDLEKTSLTLTEFFLLWRITEDFIIKTGGGTIQKEFDRVKLNYPAISFGPMFILRKIYLGASGNLLVEQGGKGFSPYSISLTLGLKFE
jgi:hypothetical protein